MSLIKKVKLPGGTIYDIGTNWANIEDIPPIWKLENDTHMSANTSFDDYTTLGNYYIAYNTISPTILTEGKPKTGNLYGALKVSYDLGSKTNTASIAHLRQDWFVHGSPQHYVRNTGNDETWGNWNTYTYKASDGDTEEGSINQPVYVANTGKILPTNIFQIGEKVTTLSTSKTLYIKTDIELTNNLYRNIYGKIFGYQTGFGPIDISFSTYYNKTQITDCFYSDPFNIIDTFEVYKNTEDKVFIKILFTKAYITARVLVYHGQTASNENHATDLATSTAETLTLLATGVLKNGSSDAANLVSTDNAIVRFDGTAGKFQNSKVLINDNGDIIMSKIDGITPGCSLQYDNTLNTLNFVFD